MLAAKTLPLPSPRFKDLTFRDSNLHFPVSLPTIKANGKINSNPFLNSCLKTSLESIVAPVPFSTPAPTRVKILSEALPFIQKFRGKTVIVKYGGAAMKSEALQASVIADLVLLSCVEIVSMVLVGKVNKHLVSLINKAGATAVGLSGIDGHLLTARPSPNSAQLGFVGEIERVDPAVLRPLIDNYHIPVIASVAADKTGQSYNINADTAAGELAATLGAEKLILLTDVAGILKDRDDPGSLVKEIDIKGAKKMIDDGKIAGGMIPKVNCCLRSLAQGVRTASIIDGRLEHSLLLEILTDQGAGTMITG
nr:acetylglutamate kinase, chloroplastic [Ipomoea batatas]